MQIADSRLQSQPTSEKGRLTKVIAQRCLLCYLALVVAGCGGTYEPTSRQGQAECYRAEFGTLPPAGVTNIHAKQIIIGDAARAWLRFEATPGVVDSLLMRFAPTNRQAFDEHSGGANTPAWWTPDTSNITAFYGTSGWRKDFSYSRAVIAHDADKRVVYFCHDAFD
jgi:hypothetical protein